MNRVTDERGRSSRMKVLFCPWTNGVGFGYVGRSLVIADELRAAGHECVFASDSSEGLVARCGFSVCPAEGRHGVSVPDMAERQGEYIRIDNLDTVFGMARFYHAARIREHVHADVQVIDRVRPDVVVVDLHPTAAIAARSRGIPVVSVADADFLREDENSWMTWLAPDEVRAPYPSCLPAFSEVTRELGLGSLQHVSDVLWGDITLLASSPELEAALPPMRERGRLEYIGPLYWDPPWSDGPDRLRGFGEGQKRIYVTLGHGGKTLKHQMDAVLEGCNLPGTAVFVSLGLRPSDKQPTLPNNAIAGGFTGLQAPLRWADIVISHGGYATVTAALQFGKPSIVIPFMSEQESNGRLFLEQTGAGFVLRKTAPVKRGKETVEYHMRYSGASTSDNFSAREVSQGVTELLEKAEYASNARAIGATLEQRATSRSFPRLIESVCRA